MKELQEYYTEAGEPLKCAVCKSTELKSWLVSSINGVNTMETMCHCGQVVGRSVAGGYDKDYIVWCAERLGMQKETIP